MKHAVLFHDKLQQQGVKVFQFFVRREIIDIHNEQCTTPVLNDEIESEELHFAHGTELR